MIHKFVGYQWYDETSEHAGGFVAWCECGMGSPPKPTQLEASQSLLEHIVDPTRFPK